MSTEKVVIITLALLIGALTLMGTSYNLVKQGKLITLVKAGATPLEASCAINDDYGKQPVCMVLGAKQ